MKVRDGQSLYLNIIRASRSGLWVIPWHYGNKYRHVGNVGNKASCPPVFFVKNTSSKHREHICGRYKCTRICVHTFLPGFPFLPSFLFFFFLSNPKRSAGYWGAKLHFIFHRLLFLSQQHEALQVQSILVYSREVINKKIKKESW